MIITYKTIIRSIMEYAAPVWAPSIKNTNWHKLQMIQNQALRIATGCLKMSSEDHIHQESKVLPIQTHSQMICKQYLAGCKHTLHPGNKNLGAPPPPRDKKKTLQVFEQEVSEFFNNGQTIDGAIKNIHTNTMKEMVRNYSNNRVLSAPPPEIDSTLY